ncbi:amino acid--tRNA ligase-related protein, partial [Acinetobacter baumannii]|nr:EF-P lysine aminoacylase GenX [Acinetobacter baumannii]
ILLEEVPHFAQCSGIALGIDRLLLVATDQLKIEKVIAFPAEIA